MITIHINFKNGFKLNIHKNQAKPIKAFANCNQNQQFQE